MCTAAPSLVPEHLVVVPHGAAREAHPGLGEGDAFGVQLAQRVLDAEVRDDEILLVHERAHARVDLEQLAADPLNALEVVERQVEDDLATELHEVGPVDGLERIARPVRNSSRVRVWWNTISPLSANRSTVISGASTYSISMSSGNGSTPRNRPSNSGRVM